MGYTTDFNGQFKLDKPLTAAQVAYLKRFNETRRMKRDAEKTAKRSDPTREKVGLDVGPDGAYFVGAEGFMGQGHDEDVVEHNSPPTGQPGLWCQWVPTEDGGAIEWDEGEKFYSYVKWIEYIIEHFLTPWGRKLTGKVSWAGESSDDRGVICIVDNVVRAEEDVISNALDGDVPLAGEVLKTLEYLADCQLATVAGMAMKKRRPKGEYTRQIAIGQTAVDAVVKFNAPQSTRVKAVIEIGNVYAWAADYEA